MRMMMVADYDDDGGNGNDDDHHHHPNDDHDHNHDDYNDDDADYGDFYNDSKINDFITVYGPPGCHWWMYAGPRLNIKTVLSTYGDFHVKDKTAVRTSYL